MSSSLLSCFFFLLLVQQQISQLDEDCAKEQMKVQQEFATKLRPLYAERQKLLKKIPKFWGHIIQDIMAFEDHIILCETDKEILEVDSTGISIIIMFINGCRASNG